MDGSKWCGAWNEANRHLSNKSFEKVRNRVTKVTSVRVSKSFFLLRKRRIRWQRAGLKKTNAGQIKRQTQHLESQVKPGKQNIHTHTHKVGGLPCTHLHTDCSLFRCVGRDPTDTFRVFCLQISDEQILHGHAGKEEIRRRREKQEMQRTETNRAGNGDSLWFSSSLDRTSRKRRVE